MRRALSVALASSVAGTALASGPAPDVVPVRTVSGTLPLDPRSASWEAIPTHSAWVAPQRTTHLNDSAATPHVARAAHRVSVRAATNGKDLAILLEWPDDSETRPVDTDVYGDSVALQFPLRFGTGQTLPYIGMGDAEQKVVLALARATASGTDLREAVAAGFGSSTRAELSAFKAQMSYDSTAKVWRAVISRPLSIEGHDLAKGLVPFALAVWDGQKAERGGNKALSGWMLLRISNFPEETGYLKSLSFGIEPDEAGDPAKGRTLVESICIACHRFGDKQIAPPEIAPDLSNIGVIASRRYLFESITNPSGLIVPNLNPNRMYSKSAAPDPHRAQPNDASYLWHTDVNGKSTSKMPPFAGLPKADLAAIVAYLATLGLPSQESSK
ncbi:MAG: c-type cytochrome [Deltaproteobacteria bacterium]|nr:c-type cytochrome [Deltaproteobacteria bacterium]